MAIKYIPLQTKRNDVAEGQPFLIQLKMAVVELKSFQEPHITAVEVRRPSAEPSFISFFIDEVLSKSDANTQCCGEGAKGQSYKPGGRTSCCFGKFSTLGFQFSRLKNTVFKNASSTPLEINLLK